MPATIDTYPDFLDQVRRLVLQHRELKGEPLRLAVYFAPPRKPAGDVFLFEVADHFNGGEIDPDRKLFEFGYGTTPAFPLPDGGKLRMVLTNPAELRQAAREGWEGLEGLRAARRAGRAMVVYADAVGRKLWDSIK